jgi:hypothetical protein
VAWIENANGTVQRIIFYGRQNKPAHGRSATAWHRCVITPWLVRSTEVGRRWRPPSKWHR